MPCLPYWHTVPVPRRRISREDGPVDVHYRQDEVFQRNIQPARDQAIDGLRACRLVRQTGLQETSMGIFDRFSSKDVDQFAKSLAADISKRYPPSLDQAKEKKVSQNRIARVLEDAFKKAVDFKAHKDLGVYRKARLGNTFRWELTELGYSKPFVEMATEGLVVYITRKTSSVTAAGAGKR
jgi:hypothetical protein